MKKWEYLFYDLPTSKNNNLLVEGKKIEIAGKEGWELVTNLSRNESIVLIFKRPL